MRRNLNCSKATLNQYDKSGQQITCWKDYNKQTKKGAVNKSGITPCEYYCKSTKPDIIIEDYEKQTCSHSNGSDEE
jgi:hypothetical protein